jgi:hypothetical protein
MDGTSTPWTMVQLRRQPFIFSEMHANPWAAPPAPAAPPTRLVAEAELHSAALNQLHELGPECPHHLHRSHANFTLNPLDPASGQTIVSLSHV